MTSPSLEEISDKYHENSKSTGLENVKPGGTEGQGGWDFFQVLWPRMTLSLHVQQIASGQKEKKKLKEGLEKELGGGEWGWLRDREEGEG